jgi:glycosyltransferase involved in cell wall biosynthesis
LVITSIGGVPELVKLKLNGFLVAPNDSEQQLAEGLLLFMGDPSLRAAVGHEAQSTYVKHFRPQVMTRRLEESLRT